MPLRKNKTEAFDLLGMAMTDYLAGQESAHVMVCSSLWDPQRTDASVFFRCYADMPAWEKTAMDLAHGRILDIGAGAGAHVRHLQSMGMDICALELSTQACEVMSKLNISNIVNSDIFTFSDNLGFDTLLLLMNGSGIARTLDNLPGLLSKCKSLLRPGGQILLDSTDILYMYREEDGSVWLNLNAGYYGEVDMWMEYKGQKSLKMSWLYVDQEMLSQVASGMGLQTDILYEDEGGQFLARLF
jgi:SAM-dependent methyltransferase